MEYSLTRSKGGLFREFNEATIEQIAKTSPSLPVVGIDESAEAQQRRWSAWQVIRKRGLR